MRSGRKRVWVVLIALGLLSCSNSGNEAGTVERVSGADLQLRIRSAVALPSPLDRAESLVAELRLLDEDNIEAVHEALKRERSLLSETELRLFFEAWASFSGKAAYENALEWPSTAARVIVVEAALEGWARKKPHEASERVDMELANRGRVNLSPESLWTPLVAGWVHSGQPGVEEYVVAQENGSWPLLSRAMVGAQVRKLGGKGVLGWAGEALHTPEMDDSLKGLIFRLATHHAAKQSPAFTAEWIEPYLEENWASEGQRLVFEGWLFSKPDEAMAWGVGAMDPKDFRLLGVVAFRKWMKLDEASATEWIRNSRRGPIADPGLFVLAGSETRSAHFQEAIALAEEIQWLSMRERALSNVASSWYRSSPLVAESWLQSSSLPEEVREKIRESGYSGPKEDFQP